MPNDADRPGSFGDLDAAAIARVLDGEKDQFAELVRRYQAALYRHALAMVMDRDAAADMVQDAFVRTYVNLRECRDRTRYRAWLFQTLRNRCLDYLKESARRGVRLDEAGVLVDAAARPDERFDRTCVRSAIEAALLRLPVEQREIFVMHYVHGMAYDVLAEQLGVSLSAVKMRALRAREMLAETLRRAGVTGAVPVSSMDKA